MPKYTLEDGEKVKRVLLDGEDVTDRCTEADTDEGWVAVYPINPRELSFDELKRGTDKAYGNVEVELYEGAEVHTLRGGEIVTMDPEYKPINWRDLSSIQEVDLALKAEWEDAPDWLISVTVSGYTHDLYTWKPVLKGMEPSSYIIRHNGKRLEAEEIIARLEELDGHKTAYRDLTPEEKGVDDAQ